MKEFMLLIRNEENALDALAPEQVQDHIKKVGGFITKKITEGVMRSAQPLEMEGRIVSYTDGNFTDGPFNETKEVISGYYIIVAETIDDAVNIAKEDPRFMDGKWRIEIRPILKIEGINK
jgi:hypothetical protein